MGGMLQETVPDGDSRHAARPRRMFPVDTLGGVSGYRPIEFGGGSFAVVAALTLVFLALFS